MESPPAQTIRIAAALIHRPDGHTLLVRKRGTTAFMQPGGKIAPGETPIAALIRELQEELGLKIAPSQAIYLGNFTAPAANEPGFTVEAEIFSLEVSETPRPQAEIDEIIWLNPSLTSGLALAPLTQSLIHSFKKPAAR